MDQPLATQVKEAIVRCLKLPMAPQDIADDIPLFGEGLGLDSIDVARAGPRARTHVQRQDHRRATRPPRASQRQDDRRAHRTDERAGAGRGGLRPRGRTGAQLPDGRRRRVVPRLRRRRPARPRAVAAPSEPRRVHHRPRPRPARPARRDGHVLRARLDRRAPPRSRRTHRVGRPRGRRRTASRIAASSSWTKPRSPRSWPAPTPRSRRPGRRARSASARRSGRSTTARPGLSAVLARAGFRYDSSMSPLRLVGNPNYPQVPHRRDTPHGTLLEVPPLVGRRFGQHFPLGGGWGLRMSRPVDGHPGDRGPQPPRRTRHALRASLGARPEPPRVALPSALAIQPLLPARRIRRRGSTRSCRVRRFRPDRRRGSSLEAPHEARSCALAARRVAGGGAGRRRRPPTLRGIGVDETLDRDAVLAPALDRARLTGVGRAGLRPPARAAGRPALVRLPGRRRLRPARRAARSLRAAGRSRSCSCSSTRRRTWPASTPGARRCAPWSRTPRQGARLPGRRPASEVPRARRRATTATCCSSSPCRCARSTRRR